MKNSVLLFKNVKTGKYLVPKVRYPVPNTADFRPIVVTAHDIYSISGSESEKRLKFFKKNIVWKTIRIIAFGFILLVGLLSVSAVIFPYLQNRVYGLLPFTDVMQKFIGVILSVAIIAGYALLYEIFSDEATKQLQIKFSRDLTINEIKKLTYEVIDESSEGYVDIKEYFLSKVNIWMLLSSDMKKVLLKNMRHDFDSIPLLIHLLKDKDVQHVLSLLEIDREDMLSRLDRRGCPKLGYHGIAALLVYATLLAVTARIKKVNKSTLLLAMLMSFPVFYKNLHIAYNEEQLALALRMADGHIELQGYMPTVKDRILHKDFKMLTKCISVFKSDVSSHHISISDVIKTTSICYMKIKDKIEELLLLEGLSDTNKKIAILNFSKYIDIIIQTGAYIANDIAFLKNKTDILIINNFVYRKSKSIQSKLKELLYGLMQHKIPVIILTDQNISIEGFNIRGISIDWPQSDRLIALADYAELKNINASALALSSLFSLQMYIYDWMKFLESKDNKFKDVQYIVQRFATQKGIPYDVAKGLITLAGRANNLDLHIQGQNRVKKIILRHLFEALWKYKKGKPLVKILLVAPESYGKTYIVESIHKLFWNDKPFILVDLQSETLSSKLEGRDNIGTLLIKNIEQATEADMQRIAEALQYGTISFGYSQAKVDNSMVFFTTTLGGGLFTKGIKEAATFDVIANKIVMYVNKKLYGSIVINLDNIIVLDWYKTEELSVIIESLSREYEVNINKDKIINISSKARVLMHPFKYIRAKLSKMSQS